MMCFGKVMFWKNAILRCCYEKNPLKKIYNTTQISLNPFENFDHPDKKLNYPPNLMTTPLPTEEALPPPPPSLKNLNPIENS